MEEKYKKAKLQIEKMKGLNKQMKEKVKRSTSSGINRDRFRSSHTRVTKESHVNMLEVKRLESHVERLKADLRYLQTQNSDLKSRMKDMQRSGDSQAVSKRYEAEKSKNLYLENENIQLRKQIRELNSKYKMFIDEKNRQTVGSFINRKSVNVREVEEMKMTTTSLRRENRELKERMQNMGNELKMKSNISDAVSKKEYELDAMRSNINSLSDENNYLRGKVMKLEMEIANLKETLRIKEIEMSKMGSGNDHMVKMYQKLYNDMKRECEIYMDKVKQLSMQLQNSNYGADNLTYTKNVYKSKA
jgi:cell division protein FtsB